jgi:DNA-binding NarL/FixJ family response regulator
VAALRVVLADDSLLIREGVSQLIGAAEDLELVGTAGDFDALLRAVEQHRPDVVITDIRMPPTGTDEGIRAANQLRTTHPEVGVVVLSQYVDPWYPLALLRDGTRGRAYLLKERVGDLNQLRDAVLAVAKGGSVLDPKVVDALVGARGARSPVDRLTPREREVLAEMATGRNNAAIAAALVLTERAVEKHINAIFAKLGLAAEPDVNKRVRAVLLFLESSHGGAGTTAT